LGSTAQPTEGALKTQGYGTGRRKNAVARVFIRPGSGKFQVNGRAVDSYFKNVTWLMRATEPLKFTNTANELDVMATCNGGGVGGQAGAVRMGLSRALSVLNPDLRHGLRNNGFLTRDSRMRERKKYGQKGARKRFQFSKR
jgi:small subunit ribosomal protein S9